MRIEFLYLGKTREKYLAAGIEGFCGRLGHYAEVKIRVIKDIKPAGRPEKVVKEEEGKALLQKVEPGVFLIALDPGGRQFSSEELAEELGKWRDSGRRNLAVVLGGSLGLSEKVLGRADLVMSMSRMTFTHEMARLLVLEQFYRAFNILAGSAYHK